MYSLLEETLTNFQNFNAIPAGRKVVLQGLIDYIQKRVDKNLPVNLNFICTHNSRRSHFAQVWAQVSASYYHIDHIFCSSGGTEEMAVHPQVLETLVRSGFAVYKISDGNNPIFAIKFDGNLPAIIAFSKVFNHGFNPQSQFGAVMTCSQADEGCPFIAGAEARLSIPFEDPKIADGTKEQSAVYEKRSDEIAMEMMYVFSKINR